MNFQAVDYTAEVRTHQLTDCFSPKILQVFLNGQLAGRHTGGYDAFSFDITELLVEGEQEIVVEVEDPTESQVGIKEGLLEEDVLGHPGGQAVVGGGRALWHLLHSHLWHLAGALVPSQLCTQFSIDGLAGAGT